MIYLDDRWAIDGGDSNSYTGILWCLGCHDRPWAPERPIFGHVRYTSSERARQKLRVERYLARGATGARQTAQSRSS